MIVPFGDAHLELRCAGTIYWSDTATLIVSDLHLEKGSSFSLRGFFLPPHDTKDTLERLEKEVLDKRPRLLILLGDSFHDADGYARLNDTDRHALDRIMRRQETVWILGNHDKGFVPDGIDAHERFERDGLVFTHQATAADVFEISGHYHPATSFHYKGHKIRGRCFAVSGQKIILPSFGSFTGGMRVGDAVFKEAMASDFDVFLCSERRIFKVPGDLLEK